MLKQPALHTNELTKILSTNDELLAIGEVDSKGRINKLIENQPLIDRQNRKAPFVFILEELQPANLRLNEVQIHRLNAQTFAFLYIKKNSVNNYSFFFTTQDTFNNIFENGNSLFTNILLDLNSSSGENLEWANDIKKYPALKGKLYKNTTLLAFVKSKDLQFATVSFIKKEKAFHFTKILITKSMYFSGFLLGILAIIGVIFSITLTRPITLLTASANEIAKGNFSKKFIVSTSDEIGELGNSLNIMISEISYILSTKDKDIQGLKSANIKLDVDVRSLTKKLETSIKHEMEEKNYSQKVVKIFQNKLHFHSYINDVNKLFTQLLLSVDKKSNTINLELATSTLHDLDFSFEMYSIINLQRIVRENISSLKNLKTDFNKNFTQLQAEWKNEILTLDQTFNTDFSNGIITKEIEASKIVSLKKLLDHIPNKQIQDLFYSNFVNEHLENYFLPYNDYIQSLASKFGKNIARFEMNSRMFKIDPVPYIEFINVLSHLIKYCVLSEIEPESKRLELGKPAQGKIIINCDLVVDDFAQLKITIIDDGRGIDSFFSTYDELGTKSEKYIGMSVIKDELAKRLGQLEVKSELGIGSIYTFTFPYTVVVLSS